MGEPDLRDDHDFFTVRAADLKTHPNIIGNQMFAAPPAFEENVGHPDHDSMILLSYRAAIRKNPRPHLPAVPLCQFALDGLLDSDT